MPDSNNMLWLLLLLVWIPVHIAVMICGLFHGLGKLLFGALARLTILLGMWQNEVIFIWVIVVIYLIEIAGSVIDLVQEETRHQVGKAITA